jgi:hypothetical protein
MGPVLNAVRPSTAPRASMPQGLSTVVPLRMPEAALVSARIRSAHLAAA